MRQISYGDLTEVQRRLLAEAEQVMETAYAPYSGFYVGAALLSPDGQIVRGSNVENSAYGSSICAERTAVLTANSMRIRAFEKLAIIARGNGFDTTQVSAPCGSCRQVLVEFTQLSGINLEIILSTTQKDRITVVNFDEIVPLPFGPRDVGVDLGRYK